MEKRWSERRRLQVGVEVYRQGELLGSCSSHDIGLGGTFLESTCAENMSKDAEVDLVFLLESEGVNKRHNVHAKVTRVTDNGIGLKFCGFDTGVFRSLQELMAYAKTNPGNTTQGSIVNH
jgi:hypothetical protein